MFQCSGVKDEDTVMSAKVNTDAPPKEPDPAPSDPPVPSTKEDILIPVSDSVAKKARAQPHTTTAFLLQGELLGKGAEFHTMADAHWHCLFFFLPLSESKVAKSLYSGALKTVFGRKSLTLD